MTVSNPRKQDRAITFLTQEEVQRLFDAIKTKRDRAIFAVAYRHGLRASEVGMLQRTDVDKKAARITINRVKGSMSGPMSPYRAFFNLNNKCRIGKDRAYNGKSTSTSDPSLAKGRAAEPLVPCCHHS